MKNQMGKHLKTLLTLLLLFLLSCPTSLHGEQYTQGTIIDAGNYFVTGPPGYGWFVTLQKNEGIVDFEKPSVSRATGLIYDTTIIKVLRNWVADKKFKNATEEEVANNYRDGEEKDMIWRGVMTRQYKLSDVKKGTTITGDKKVYYMSYKTLYRNNWNSEAGLYLFFPVDFNERHFFYIFLINHSYIQGSVPKGDLTPIIPVIKSLQIK